MSPQLQPKDSDEMRPEYDCSQGVRGKHYEACQVGTNVVFLEPDIAAVFPDSASVNQALRLLVRLSKTKAFAGSRPDKALRLTSHARRKSKPTMFICGNGAAAKKMVTGVLDAFGWDVADMGGAEAARAIEPLCILWCIPGFLRQQWTHAFKLLT